MNKVEPEKWNQILFVVDENNFIKLYINRKPDSSFSLPDLSYDALSSKLLFGITESAKKSGNWTEQYAGKIDEFFRFNKRLTEFEFSQLYIWHLTN